MKVQIISDLHIDLANGLSQNKKLCFDKILKPHPEADCLIIAGDIGFGIRKRFKKFIKYCSLNFKQTFMVLGNHEFYQSRRLNAPTMMQQKKRIRFIISHYTNVCLLDNDAIPFKNYVLLGTTLWSQPSDTLLNKLNDFNQIKVRPDQDLTPHEVRQMNAECVAWLKIKLEAYASSKVIVISHHVPSFKLLNEPNNEYSSAYANDLDVLIMNNSIKLWVFGHSHNIVDQTIGLCRCVSNPVGYENEHVNQCQYQSQCICHLDDK